jgi:hypothetical protein
MMDRRSFINLAVLVLPVAFLALWSASLSWRHHNSPTYEVVMAGYDPRDIVYGKYIIFTYDWNHAESQKPEGQKNLPVSGRFYVPEHDAFDLEGMMRDRVKHVFKATVALSGKDTQIKNVTINGLPWQDALDLWRQTKDNLAQ